MTTRKKLFALLAWLQLAISIVMGVLVIWAYLSYRVPMNQIMLSLETALRTGSSLIEGSRETIEARKVHLDETGKLLVTLRYTLTKFLQAVNNQENMVPKYAESLRSASSIAGSMGGMLRDTGKELLVVRVPVDIEMDGWKPILIIRYPFKNLAATLDQNAREFESISKHILTISNSITRDGRNMATAITASTNQAINMVNETEKTLELLKQELPRALADLQALSESLKNISVQFHFLSYIGIVLLAFGLLMSAWCFVHSIGALMVVKSQTFEKPASMTIAAINL